MPKLTHKPFYRRNLPHIHPPGSTYIITFRLAGSIPLQKQGELHQEFAQIQSKLSKIADPDVRRHQIHIARKQLIGKWDQILDDALEGPIWFKDPEIASIVLEILHSINGNSVDLYAFCIMPNHVHLVCKPRCKEDEVEYSLAEIMRVIKGRSAFLANRKLGRTGEFWQHESYDHVIQNEAELERVVKYVVYNPVRAGLVEYWDQWRWTYCKYELL